MNNFLYGVSTIGDLSPLPYKDIASISAVSAWQAVSFAFAQAGNNIQQAIDEFSYDQQKSKPSK
ncbi:hypothetical protein [Treponema endosymbiont of Eucomonympha sp.]|uniref:hypothetical protein n=1 Tax=Treponema endosymbiont of Eucomonympha sp. TaxID=1580831 RepID=UPI000ADDB1B7|nr:hypothetical protein [Treponema endosymbiont of Eucomonympha sp.]